MAQTQNDALEKIARMVLNEVPQNQIAMCCGVTDGRISQIIKTEEFIAVLQSLSTEHFEKQQLLASGWDRVEELSLVAVITALETKHDPDYALKAAALANRATRRGIIPQNNPGVGAAGVRTVINLNANFVQNLQENFQISDERTERKENGTFERKRMNMLSVAGVETMLGHKKQPELDIDLSDFNG